MADLIEDDFMAWFAHEYWLDLPICNEGRYYDNTHRDHYGVIANFIESVTRVLNEQMQHFMFWRSKQLYSMTAHDVSYCGQYTWQIAFNEIS